MTTTYTALTPAIIAWAAERGLLHPDGTANKATPLAQHQKTLEEIGEAKEALENWRVAQGPEKSAWEPFLNKDVWASVDDYLAAIKNDAALELGDILVTLVLQAGMQGSTLEVCMGIPARLGWGPTDWPNVGDWSAMLSESISNPHSLFSRDALGEIGAIALCTEDAARTHLGMTGPECLALALEKIRDRRGVVMDGVFLKQSS